MGANRRLKNLISRIKSAVRPQRSTDPSLDHGGNHDTEAACTASDLEDFPPLLRLPTDIIVTCTDFMDYKDFVCTKNLRAGGGGWVGGGGGDNDRPVVHASAPAHTMGRNVRLGPHFVVDFFFASPRPSPFRTCAQVSGRARIQHATSNRKRPRARLQSYSLRIHTNQPLVSLLRVHRCRLHK